jgi:hypothetical protein
LKLLEANPRYGGVGSRMMRIAIELSLEEGYKGRVGLHSLPGQARGGPEWFYENTCKMVPVEAERDGEGLLYFELTPDKATEFLNGGTS